MKFQGFFLAGLVVAFAACKTTYKATDRNSTTDSTAVSTDSTRASMDTTSSDMNRMTDSARISQPDSSKMDSSRMEPGNRSMEDSASNRSGTDSMRNQPITDTSRSIPGIDSTGNKPTTMDSASAGTQVPENIQSAFTTQYSSASNATWSAYDSLAAVPIDLRLSGWKKMDAEDYMVKFDFEGDTYYAWYDSDGKWVGSAYTMNDFTKLPSAVNSAVNNAIKKRYTDYNISQVNREFQKGKKAYEVELTKGDEKVRMLIGEDGKIGQIFKYAGTTKDNQ